MKPLDLGQLARAAPLNKRSKPVAQFEGRSMQVSRFSKHPRWEIHPRGEELLQIIAGELEVILLQEKTEPILLSPGEIFVIPANTWHSPIPHGPVSLLSIADYDETRVSDDDDPSDRS